IRNMRFIKASSFYDYAKRARLSLLGVDIGKTQSGIRNMRFIKASSLYDYAKRARLSLLGVDIGKTQSGVCVAYPTSGVIVLARLSIDGPIYSFKHNLIDEAADSFEFSTALNRLAKEYKAIGFHFGFPYDQRFLVEEMLNRMNDLSL
ncbi:hypothetical protein Q3G72_016287, partial [Acer saccharum]